MKAKAEGHVCWEETAKRILLFAGSYLDFDGRYSPGGRQRFIRDLAKLIQAWGRDVVVVQKARSAFECLCPDGVPVVGITSQLRAVGDVRFSHAARALARPGDCWLYASGEDAWPYFATGSKAIQHGVWWDGPQSYGVRTIQRTRSMAMVRRVQSVLCVDTNFINWLRCEGPEGYRLSNRCQYIPNYADLALLPVTTRHEGQPLTIITARRFEEKRGTELLLNSLAVLWRNKVTFRAHISTVGGLTYVKKRCDELGISDLVSVSEDSMGRVLARYGDCHVAAVPTLWSEGTSFACVEALAAGLPVVCTAVGGLGNLVLPNFNGFVVRPDAEAFAGALQALADGAMWQMMHRNALSMRESLGLERWKRDVAPWLAA